MARTGRPKKKFNRRHITIFIDENILSRVDDCVSDIKKMNREYTRSDFINEAALAYLEHRGRKENSNDG